MHNFFTYLSALFFGGLSAAVGWLIYTQSGPTREPGRRQDLFDRGIDALIARLGPEGAGLALMGLGVVIAAVIVWWRRIPSAPVRTQADLDRVESFDFAASLARMSQRLTAAQAGMTQDEAKAYRHKPPSWLASEPDKTLLRQYDDNEILIREGVVAWAHIVQANGTLFGKGSVDSPAVVLYSHDPSIAEEPFFLSEVAELLFEQKGQTTSPELQRFADMLASEHTNNYDVPVPDELTDGVPTLYTTLMINRARLPGGYLAERLFPVIVSPRRSSAVAILPLDFWDEAFIRAMW